MTDWLGKPYYSLDAYLKKTFGEKVYKLSLDGGMTCPNRDGTCGDRGCIFCSAGGSGDFAGDRNKSIPEQIREQKSLLQQKRPVHKFIAYFQAYTNTYAPVEYLEKIFREAISDEEVVVLSDRNETGLLRGRGSFSVRRAEPDQTGLGGAGTADDA